jgi:rod shape-determining protein MreC
LARGKDAFWLYMTVALLLLALEVFGPGVPRRIRGYVNDLAAPVLLILEGPVRGVQAGIERIAGVSDIYLENQDLRDENIKLLQWREAAQRLLLENERLRSILKVPLREIPPLATAHVIGMGGGGFERNVLINAGAKDGISADMPVIDEVGLVGRTIQIGYWTTRVLLITDFSSRVPVRLERTGDVAIAEGLNEPFLRLRFISAEADVKIGDRVVTSGHGLLFPPDLPVAQVASIEDGIILLTPLTLLEALDYVRVMDYRPLPPEVAPQAPEQVEKDAQVSE